MAVVVCDGVHEEGMKVSESLYNREKGERGMKVGKLRMKNEVLTCSELSFTVLGCSPPPRSLPALFGIESD